MKILKNKQLDYSEKSKNRKKPKRISKSKI
jgi:hypothetical protein